MRTATGFGVFVEGVPPIAPGMGAHEGPETRWLTERPRQEDLVAATISRFRPSPSCASSAAPGRSGTGASATVAEKALGEGRCATSREAPRLTASGDPARPRCFHVSCSWSRERLGCGFVSPDPLRRTSAGRARRSVQGLKRLALKSRSFVPLNRFVFAPSGSMPGFQASRRQPPRIVGEHGMCILEVLRSPSGHVRRLRLRV